MNNVLLIGTLVSKEIEDVCIRNGIRPSPADIAQKYICHGLEQQDNIKILDIIGSVRIAAFPKCKILNIKTIKEKNNLGEHISVGFFNIPFLGFIIRKIRICHEAKKWAHEHINSENVTVILYSMHSPFMNAAKIIKKIIPNSKIVLIVADLPLLMSADIVRIAKRIDWLIIQRLMKYIDKYLLYTKYMAEYLHLNDNEWMLFEGLIDSEKIVKNKQEKTSEKLCIYAGNLEKQYGIDTLINAFSRITCDAHLKVYGSGKDIPRIKKIINNVDNVEYSGILPAEKMFEEFKHASLLVNPRPSDLALSKYSFPSKTFEYMASGTPVVMNKLPGLTDEYYNHILFFDNENSIAYAKKLDSIFSIDNNELERFGLESALFLLKNKTSFLVMKNVLDFINK